MDPASFIATITKAWDKSGPALWALGFACTLAAVALALAARIEPDVFGLPAPEAEVSLLPLGLALLVVAGFRTFHERRNPPVRFVPREQTFRWSITKQADGRNIVHISGNFEVYNLRNQPLILADIKCIRPKITGEFVNRDVSLHMQDGPYSGRYPIAARTKGDGSLHLYAFQDFSSRRGRPVKLVVKISDQFGKWYKVTVPRVRGL